MEKKELFKHLVDCILAIAISFISTTLAAGQIDGTTILINGMTGLLVGLIKFRDVWNTHLNEESPIPTLFL